MPQFRAFSAIGICVVLAAATLAYLAWWRAAPGSVVVYCAHDAVFAEAVLAEFTRRTGIAVVVRYDTEATKSLGLAQRLVSEADHPACDLFWNNELLATLDLEQRGLLAPYRGPGWSRMPERFRDAQAAWTGFAARMRVVLVNTGSLQANDAAIRQRLAGDLSRVAIAKPMFGTTLTHYSVLWDRLGPEGLQSWHRDTRQRGIREVDGNGMVKELVAEGACDLGFTDTDDAFAAIDAGKPVAFAALRLDDGATVVIPNTVAIMRGAPHAASAQRLADYLLSADTELALARSASRQIPLGPVDEAQMPAEVRSLRADAQRGCALEGLLAARTSCLAWLVQEYAR